MHKNVYHQAFRASSLDPMDGTPDSIPWPNPALPQMEINQHLLDQDFQPSGNHSPPNSGATDYFPDDPQSPHQRFGPPHLENWLPASGSPNLWFVLHPVGFNHIFHQFLLISEKCLLHCKYI